MSSSPRSSLVPSMPTYVNIASVWPTTSQTSYLTVSLAAFVPVGTRKVKIRLEMRPGTGSDATCRVKATADAGDGIEHEKLAVRASYLYNERTEFWIELDSSRTFKARYLLSWNGIQVFVGIVAIERGPST